MRNSFMLLDKFLLYVVGNAFLFYMGELSFCVLLTLLVLFAASISAHLDIPHLSVIVFISVCSLCLLIPLLCLFIPLFIFDIYTRAHKGFCLIALIPWIALMLSNQYLLVIISVAITMLSLVLSQRSHSAAKIYRQYNQLLDQTREKQLDFERKNKELMEKQDYELNLATLKERNRIARDLHDSIGHVLTSSILQAGAIQAISREPKTKEAVEVLQNSLTSGMNDVRQSIHNLYDQSIDLKEEILKQVQLFDFAPIDYKYNVTHRPEQHITYAFLFILKEGLSNIVRYSNASRVQLVVHEHTGFYQFILRDNGKIKKRTSSNPLATSGMGLNNIVTRVEALGGNVNISRQNGFEVFVTLPKET